MVGKSRAKGQPRTTGKRTRNNNSFDILNRSHPSDPEGLKQMILLRLGKHPQPNFPKKDERDWNQQHTIQQIKFPGQKTNEKSIRLRIVGEPPFPHERRRIQKSAGGQLDKKGELTKPANELFVNLGRGSRGKGTKENARNRRQVENYLKKLLARFNAGELSVKDYRTLRDTRLKEAPWYKREET
ncbi:MAG: hypothetical protein NUV57_02855 [archaeon]|nr:hypothetical protein [archaeon]